MNWILQSKEMKWLNGFLKMHTAYKRLISSLWIHINLKQKARRYPMNVETKREQMLLYLDKQPLFTTSIV